MYHLDCMPVMLLRGWKPWL